MMRRLLLLSSLVFASACSHTSAPVSQNDLVIINARIYTGEASMPWASALAVRGDRIVAIGDADVPLQAGRVIDAGGRLVVPGINDAHVHAPDLDGWERTANLAAAKTADDVLRAIGDAAKRGGDDSEGISVTIPPPLTGDPGFTREALDAVAPDTPVRLGVIGGHAALLNTAALKRIGISDTTEDPPGGHYGRADGKLDGWLYEHALWASDNAAGANSSDEFLLGAMRNFAATAVKYGITSVQSMPSFGTARMPSLESQAGNPLRWRWMPFQIAQVDAAPRGSVKYILDGTPLERGAALRAPYSDRAEESGRINYTPEQLRQIIEIASRSDAQLLIHIAGDAALAAVFDLMKKTPADWPSRRVRIEHGDFIGEYLDDAQKLGVIHVQNPAHLTFPPIMGARFGDRTANYQRVATVVRRGIPFALGSDGPLNPWLNIMLVTMHPQNPAEALTREEALRAYTYGSAFAEFAEKEKGTLAVGKLADFAVLSQDIFTIDAQQLPATESLLTVIGGTIAHDAMK